MGLRWQSELRIRSCYIPRCHPPLRSGRNRCLCRVAGRYDWAVVSQMGDHPSPPSRVPFFSVPSISLPVNNLSSQVCVFSCRWTVSWPFLPRQLDDASGLSLKSWRSSVQRPVTDGIGCWHFGFFSYGCGSLYHPTSPNWVTYGHTTLHCWLRALPVPGEYQLWHHHLPPTPLHVFPELLCQRRRQNRPVGRSETVSPGRNYQV